MIHTTPMDDLDQYWASEQRKADRRRDRYRKGRQHSVLRKLLLRQNPHCVHCGQRLQGDSPTEPHYACVSAGKLACVGCVQVVFATVSKESEAVPC